MRSFTTYLFSCFIIAMVAACAGSTEEKTAAIEAQPMAEEVTTPAEQPTPSFDSSSVEVAETETQVEGVLPKPNSEADVAASNRTPPANPGKAKQAPNAPSVKSNPQGYSTGYVSRKEVSLQTEPKENAAATRIFKQYEGVIILETRMTDDTGQPTKIPTWYKVECVDKKQGWVKASSVTLN